MTIHCPEPKPDFTPRILIEHCLRATSIVTGIRRDMLTGSSPQPDVVLARRLGMTIARQLTGQSLSSIGRGFGGKDHSSVVDAIRTIEVAAADSPEIRQTLQDIAARAHALAGVWPGRAIVGAPREPGGEPNPPPIVKRPAAASPVGLTDKQRREARTLRGKGWSIKGLMRRFELADEAQMYAELGEKSPRSLAA